MRSRMIAFAGALVVALSATASAQSTLPQPTDPLEQKASTIGGKAFGGVDFGGRFTDINGDGARYQRYRDLRDGPFAQNAFLTRRTEDWTLNVQANNIGYRDQKYSVTYNQVGRLKASFVYDQIPLFISGDTRTFYNEVSPGVFRLEDTMQANNEAGRTTIRDYVGTTTELELRNRRDTSMLDVVFNASREVDFKFNVTSAQRKGNMPYGAPFGFNNLIELPVPLDARTTDATTSLEYATNKVLVSVGWDGSWYENAIETLIWDNPLKINDAPSYSTAYSDGRSSSQGRMALWPDNTQQYVHGTLSFVTPGRGRLTGYIAVGESKQNAPLLAHTINTQIPNPPLERDTAEADIKNTMFNFQYSARPVDQFLLVARYRYADVSNDTAHFTTLGRVRFDGVLDDAASSPEPEPYSVLRKNFDVDATISVLPFTAVKVGYGNAVAERTFRHWEETTENTFRVSLDTTGNQYVSFRTIFENSTREGEGFDVHVLQAVAERPEMRQYDIADRDRKRFTVMSTVTPNEFFGVNFSAGIGREEYPDSLIGLREFDSDQYAVGLDVIPNDRVGFNLTYAWETYDSLQMSRNISSPGTVQEVDQTRNWFTDYTGKVKNIDATLELAEIAPKTSLRFNANWSDSKDTYVYILSANSPLTVPRPLDPVTNELLRGTVDLVYAITSQLRLGASYWYENYDVQDFALGPDLASNIVLPPIITGVPISPTNTVLLGHIYRPYTANTGMVRLTYLW